MKKIALFLESSIKVPTRGSPPFISLPLLPLVNVHVVAVISKHPAHLALGRNVSFPNRIHHIEQICQGRP